MQIFMKGEASRDYAPDEVLLTATFEYRADTYDEALRGGVEKVSSYIEKIKEVGDLKPEDFKTRAYSVAERKHINEIKAENEADLDKNLRKIVSEGFFFRQFVSLATAYDRDRLAKIMIATSMIEEAPQIQMSFGLKRTEDRRRELIGDAYNDAKSKAEALAHAAGKHLRDCIRVDLDNVENNPGFEGAQYKRVGTSTRAMDMTSFNETIKKIDESFSPDDITVKKTISCVWETSD